MSQEGWSEYEAVVPIFPLPNLVMFPRAVQFIHIFEARYKDMMEDMFATQNDSRTLATALLKPGYEGDYYSKHADVHPILCLCEVIRHETLSDGRYNLLIQGRARARVMREDRKRAYRRAELEVLALPGPIDDPITSSEQRASLRDALNQPPFDSMTGADKYLKWIDSELPLSDVTDLLTFYLLPQDEPELRQTVLSDLDVASRTKGLTAHLKTISRIHEAQSQAHESWPPEPGLN